MNLRASILSRSIAGSSGFLLVVLTALLSPSRAWGQADEHAAHHPGGAASAPGAPATGDAPASPAGGMGGMGDMGAMMKGMMPSKPTGGCNGGDCGGTGAATNPIYATLMTLPALTPERRAEIEALATQQTTEGMARLAKGSDSLNLATQVGDNLAMQRAIGVMREGLDELEAGTAARRALTEGKAPQNLALGWFKREMNLASPVPREEPRALFGLTPIHLFTMVLLVAFALAMVAMYFFKMRRAAALFRRLDGDSGRPPPGASPPLAGAPSPKSGKAPEPEKKAAAPPPDAAKAPPSGAPTSPSPQGPAAK